MDGEAGWWTTSGNIGLPPLARAMGVGRQQQHALCDVTAVVSEDLSRIWNSVELFQLYQSKGGQMLTKRQVVDQHVDHFGDTILVVSSPGVSSIVVFRNKAPTLLKLVPSDDDSDLVMSIKNMGKQIVRVVKF